MLVEAGMRTEGAREVKFGPRKMERCQVNPAFAILGCLKFLSECVFQVNALKLVISEIL